MSKKQKPKKKIRNPFARLVRAPRFSRRVHKDKRERIISRWIKDDMASN
jgi:hypothetical protein